MIISYFQWAFFWLNFLVFPWLIFNAWMIWRKKITPRARVVWGVLLVLALWFGYMRFVEPQWIVVRHEQMNSGYGTTSVKMAIISDIHLGVFKDAAFLQKVLDKVAEEKVDLLVIPGDFINDPTAEQLKSLFEPFNSVEVPIFAVTGNHDARVPGYFSSAEVRAALSGLVTMIDNGEADFHKDGKTIHLIGLSDLMEGEVDYSWLKTARRGEFNLLLTHNPDSAYKLPEGLLPVDAKIDLMLAGHTHGGQMFIPPLVYWMIPCNYPFVRGWYDVNKMPVYVTSGVGEVLLPMRFLVPPEVVIMDIYL